MMFQGMTFILCAIIKAYRFFISPLLGRNCRFHPSCSCYAQEAITKLGPVKGLWLSLKRIGRCHPLYKGDLLDPVPEE